MRFDRAEFGAVLVLWNGNRDHGKRRAAIWGQPAHLAQFSLHRTFESFRYMVTATFLQKNPSSKKIPLQNHTMIKVSPTSVLPMTEHIDNVSKVANQDKLIFLQPTPSILRDSQR